MKYADIQSEIMRLLDDNCLFEVDKVIILNECLNIAKHNWEIEQKKLKGE